MPRPAPYSSAATGHEKNDRHQSGTCRRAAGTGIGSPNASRAAYARASAAVTIRPAAPHGAWSRAPIAPSAAPNAAAVTIAPRACSATAASHLLVRPPYPTGLMVSTIDRPQGPNSVEIPATIDAITSGTRTAPPST
jgi:hypothetical protein